LELELQFGAQLIFSVCIQIQRFIIFIDYTNHFEQEADAVFSGKSKLVKVTLVASAKEIKA
jgi:hypothetical protein